MTNSNIFDNMAQGPGGNMQQGQQSGFDNWNQMVGAAPPDHFRQSVTNAMSQIDPNEYAQHIQPGVGGTNPLGQLAPHQRTGLAQSVLGELTQRGMDPSQIVGMLGGGGLSGLNTGNVSAQDLAGLLQYTQQNHPQAMGNVATQYQNQPNILQSLLGNKALMAAAGAVGSKLLSDQVNRQR
ncbi:MAG: hypothetical protein ACJ78Q_07340 [Chloroflexia bacterium]